MDIELSEDEKKVLLAFVPNGRTNTFELAARSGMRRLHVMRILIGLERKGLVAHHQHTEEGR